MPGTAGPSDGSAAGLFIVFIGLYKRGASLWRPCPFDGQFPFFAAWWSFQSARSDGHANVESSSSTWNRISQEPSNRALSSG